MVRKLQVLLPSRFPPGKIFPLDISIKSVRIDIYQLYRGTI